MSRCNFLAKYSGNIDDLLKNLSSKAAEHNVTWKGDTTKGEFQVTAMGNNVAGSYFVSGETISINISSKPFFLPCSVIETIVKKYIEV